MVYGCDDSLKITKGGVYTVNVGKSIGAGNPYEDIRYCGMINNKVFSLSGTFRSSVNLYYPINTKYININGDIFKVVSVDNHKIILGSE
jgi:hypothetical protein